MLVLGEYIDGLDFPVCNSFNPTMHRGQLCYTIDVNSLLPNNETKEGKAGELTLLLDYNTERSVQPMKRERTRRNTEKIYLNMEDEVKVKDEHDHEAEIFIHTLKSFTGYGGGIYTMNALKLILPTENFLQLADAVKGCSNDDRQHCETRKYQEQKLKDCKCIPWEFLPNGSVAEVTVKTVHFNQFDFLLQDVPACTPQGRKCYAGVDEVDFSSCLVDCKGLYADVDHVIGNASKDIALLKTLINSYESYKRSQIGSFTLSSDGDPSYWEQFEMAPQAYQPLRVVQIYFDTATYDEIVKDVSVTLADRLGVIGGTMGLFSGFSFLSALEIVYFLIKALIITVKRRYNQA